MIAIRFGGLLLSHYGWTGELVPVSKVPGELWIATVISMTAPLYALLGYFEDWTNPYAPENCSERLGHIIYGPKGVEAAAEADAGTPSFEGMSPHEVFGIAQNFTQRELANARRRLVRELHPDRWHNANIGERKAREEALKTVNAAYDMLRTKAA